MKRGRHSSSWVWKDRGVFFVKADGDNVRCEYPAEDPEGVERVCGQLYVLNT